MYVCLMFLYFGQIRARVGLEMLVHSALPKDSDDMQCFQLLYMKLPEHKVSGATRDSFSEYMMFLLT